MMRPARKHHYLPRFYLAGFTSSGLESDTLYVLDQEDGRQWQSTPAGIAFEKDLYRVDAPDTPPDAAEKSFAEFEGKAAGVLRQINETRQLPEGEQLNVLLEFVAFMAARVPGIRNAFAKGMEELMRWLNRFVVQTPEMWASIVDRAKKEGVDIPSGVPYEKVKEFVENDEYALKFPPNWFLPYLPGSVDTIFPLLARRRWSLLIATNDEFICSDRPVALVWTTPKSSPWPPGFALQQTEVSVPLTKRLAVRGSFEGPAIIVKADRKMVAAINSRTGMYSERHILSASRDIVWYKKDGSLGDTKALRRAIRSKERRG